MKALLRLFIWILAWGLSEGPLWSAHGYELAFFNGVWNTIEDARRSVVALEKALHLSSGRFKGESISFDLCYNTHMGKAADVDELFAMRFFEINAHKVENYTGAIPYMETNHWRSKVGKWSRFYAESNSLPIAPELIKKYQYEFHDFLRERSHELRAKSPTEKDLSAIHQYLSTRIKLRQKLLLVAHSQGNLFMNRAVRKLEQLGLYSPISLRALHIASPTPELHGPYLTSTKDIIVGALNDSPPSNVRAKLALGLFTIHGHGFIESYLDIKLKAEPLVSYLHGQTLGLITKNAVLNELGLLQTP